MHVVAFRDSRGSNPTIVGFNLVNNPIVPRCKSIKNGGGKKGSCSCYKQLFERSLNLKATRPDSTYVVDLTNRYKEKPIKMHLQVVKRIQRY